MFLLQTDRVVMNGKIRV